jgi:hypothetical protein
VTLGFESTQLLNWNEELIVVYRVIAGLIGAIMTVTAISWIFDPSAAAASLGMPYLDGLARSTQLGDFTAFFVFTAVMCWLGAITQQGHYLQSAGLLLFLAAVFRTLAWAIYGATFATDFIVFEVVCAGLLSFSASRIGRDANII